MALRLVELFIPKEAAGRAREVLEAHADGQYMAMWTEPAADHARITVLVTSEQTEAVMDLLNRHFSELEGFRIILVSVEASLPHPEPEPEPPRPAEPPPEPARKFGRVSREELYAQLSETVQPTPVYVVLVMLSTIVAAFGLFRSNVAVIIGAMVIAPLLGPNIALALATTLGDFDLARRAIAVSAIGLFTALGLSVLLGVVLPVRPDLPEIASRTRVGLEDIALALASGGAGALSFTTGVSSAVVGVMVAVSLLPPLATAGMLLGSGYAAPATGALLLLVTNITCVNLAGVTTFLVQGVRPVRWWEADRARRATWQAITLWIGLLTVLTAVLVVSRGR